MKSIKIFTILFALSFPIFGGEVSRRMQMALDKNQMELVEDIYDENEDELKKDPEALERLAISFERREKIKESIEVYRNLIINFNKKNHESVLQDKNNELNASFFSGTKLPYYYYKLAYLYGVLYFKSSKYTSEIERQKFKVSSEKFLELSKKVGVSPSDVKQVQDILSEKVSLDLKEEYKTSFYLFLDIVSWQDRVYLINKTTNTKYVLLSTSLGSGVGIGLKRENANYEFTLEGSYIEGNSSISSISSGTTYQQSSIGVRSLNSGVGFYYKGLSNNVMVGFDIPVMYRVGDWELPAGNYEFERDRLLGVGYFLQTKFKVYSLSIRTRMGKIFPNPGTYWTVGAMYEF